MQIDARRHERRTYKCGGDIDEEFVKEPTSRCSIVTRLQDGAHLRVETDVFEEAGTLLFDTTIEEGWLGYKEDQLEACSYLSSPCSVALAVIEELRLTTNLITSLRCNTIDISVCWPNKLPDKVLRRTSPTLVVAVSCCCCCVSIESQQNYSKFNTDKDLYKPVVVVICSVGFKLSLSSTQAFDSCVVVMRGQQHNKHLDFL